MPHDLRVNFDHDHDKRALFGVLKTLSGPCRVRICRYREGRTDRANRYYWGVVLAVAAPSLGEYLGRPMDPEACHAFFKGRFLTTPVRDPRAGDVVSVETRGTADLDSAEFFDYVERCRQFLAERAGVVVPPPDAFGPPAFTDTSKPCRALTASPSSGTSPATPRPSSTRA